MTDRPPIPEAPVELPGPSNIPHVSASGELGRLDWPPAVLLVEWPARAARLIRSVLPRKRVSAPAEDDS